MEIRTYGRKCSEEKRQNLQHIRLGPLSHCPVSTKKAGNWEFMVFEALRHLWGIFSCGSVVKNLPASAREAGDTGSIPWSGRFSWRRKWQSTPVFLPGGCHGQRNLGGCCPYGHKESDLPPPNPAGMSDLGSQQNSPSTFHHFLLAADSLQPW